jgi:hypothetical protein
MDGTLMAMILIEDDYKQVYVWVDDQNHDLELSPHFDYSEDALLWRDRMKKELNGDKNGN